MIAEMAQAAQETAKVHTVGTETLIGLGVLIVSNVGLWLEKFIQISKNKTACEEAEAREAEAEAKVAEAKSVATAERIKGDDTHSKFILSHVEMLQRHESEIGALKGVTARLERENREDHRQIFDQISDVKDLIIERLPKAAD